jgi:hypothetical protein
MLWKSYGFFFLVSFVGVITWQNQNFYNFSHFNVSEMESLHHNIIIRRRVVMGWMTQTYNKKSSIDWGTMWDEDRHPRRILKDIW